MATVSSPSTVDLFASRMADALTAKEAGNAALQQGQTKAASFQYKKVYLLLAEYLPDGVSCVGPSGAAQDTEAAGVLQLLGRRTPSAEASAAAAQSSQAPPAASGVSPSPSPSSTAAASVAKGYTALSPSQKDTLWELYGATLNNLALVHLKLGRYRDGVAVATTLLEVLPTYTTHFTNNAKALLRRASCAIHLCDFEAAEKDLATLRALAADPSTAAAVDVAAVNNVADDLAKAKGAVASEEKDMWRKAFTS